VELAARVRQGGLGWFRRGWNCFDATVIAVWMLPWLGVDASLLRLARLARLVHLMRHVSAADPVHPARYRCGCWWHCRAGSRLHRISGVEPEPLM
jgi:hypothetical protein